MRCAICRNSDSAVLREVFLASLAARKAVFGGLEVAQFGLEVVAGVGQRRQVGGDQPKSRQVRVQHRNEVIHPRQKLGVVRWNLFACHRLTSWFPFVPCADTPAGSAILSIGSSFLSFLSIASPFLSIGLSIVSMGLLIL
jgi:hypothetical protein